MNQDYMREAIRLSMQMMRRGKGGPFGAVVVKGNKIVGRGSNQVTSGNDPTAHAEIVAIRDACKRLKTFCLDDCDLYTSCEPCPMCLSAIYWARIRSVYYGNTRKDAAKIAFDDDEIYREVALPIRKRKLVMKPLLRNEALVAFKEWAERRSGQNSVLSLRVLGEKKVRRIRHRLTPISGRCFGATTLLDGILECQGHSSS